MAPLPDDPHEPELPLDLASRLRRGAVRDSGHPGAQDSDMTDPPRPWHDEETVAAPLSPPQANLATEVETDVLLGEALWRQRATLDRRVLHWMSPALLIATIDTGTWQLGVRRLVPKAEIAQARFVGRPDTAHLMPDGFRATTLYEVFWRFGLHGPAALECLPMRFLTDPIELRQMPRVPEPLLARRHRDLMRLLLKGPRRFEQLRETLQANRDDLLHDLAALYFTRAVATSEPVASNWALRSFKGLIRPDGSGGPR